MSEKLGTTLQALFSGGSVSGFILSVVPQGRLESGWIERSLVSKGLQGGLDEKSNHHDYLIPADRAVRLVRDRGLCGPNCYALFMIGEPGSDSRRFTLFQYASTSKADLDEYACAFWSLDKSPSDMTSVLLRAVIGSQLQTAKIDPPIDYTEQLRTDASVGIVVEALSARVPTSRTRTADWLASILQKPADTEAVPFRFGAMHVIPDLARLFVQWLVSLELAKRMRSPVAALIVLKEDAVDMALWDSPRGLSTFASVKREDPVMLVAKYLNPLWIGPSDRTSRQEAASKTVVKHGDSGGEGVSVPAAEQLTLDDSDSAAPASPVQKPEDTGYRELLERLEAVSLPDLQYRFSQMETQLKSIAAEQAASQEKASAASDKAAIDLLANRLRDALNRLEAMADRLALLQERVARTISEED